MRGAGIEPALRYFAQHHLDVESSYEIVEQKMHAMLSGLDLPSGTTVRCLAAVDRCYRAFGVLYDALASTIQQAAPDLVGGLRGRAAQLCAESQASLRS